MERNTKRSTTKQLIDKSRHIHGDRYDYSLVDYKNNKTKVKIICPIHSVFDQRPDGHLNGDGCRKCYVLNTRTKMVDSLSVDDGAYIDDDDTINCKCHYCGKYYKPSIQELSCRNKALMGKMNGSCNLYCSNKCKEQCSIFNQRKWPKGFQPDTSREVQPELRKMVFNRDGYICQRCDSEDSLHCHHITGVELNPIESADIDNCITLCKDCHNDTHKQDGCTYHDYKRKDCLNG